MTGSLQYIAFFRRKDFMAIFTGSGVAIVTPFLENGEVDYPSFRNMIEYHIANETDCIIVCGTTGESSTLSHEEHIECIRFCAKVVNKRIPVVAGTGSNCTETAIYLSQEAEKAGVDGLLIVTPYYNKATQKGLIKHYTDVANSVSLPIIMYNVPSRTGVNIAPETAVYLAKNVKNIVGIKEATGNISQVARLMSMAKGCLDLYSGNDDQVVPILSLGGLGVISVIANIAPKQTHDMVAKYLEGDVKAAMEMQIKSIPLCDALFSEVNPIPVKKAVELVGLCGGTLRMPLSEIEPEHQQKLEKAMKEFGI